MSLVGCIFTFGKVYRQVMEVLQILDLIHPRIAFRESGNIRQGSSPDSIS